MLSDETKDMKTFPKYYVGKNGKPKSAKSKHTSVSIARDFISAHIQP